MQQLPDILILYNLADTTDSKWTVSTFEAESVEGVIDEVNVVKKALDNLKTPCRVVGVRRLADLPAVLASARESIVWNLVEGLIGDPQDASLVPALCCAYGKMAASCDSVCLTLTLDKWRTKAVLREAGVLVPGGISVPVGGAFAKEDLGEGPFIVKPAESDASEGISGSSVFKEFGPELIAAVGAIHRDIRQPALVEQYVGNREFNISLIQDGENIRVMPVAEIDFSAFVPGKPRIIDYAAKWLTDSFEYNNTPRVIPAPVSAKVAGRIRDIALKTWNTLECQGFVRVDMRMDEEERIFVLEVNANPDISPDAGFAAALSAGSISTEDFVRMVISNAVDRLNLRKVSSPSTVPEIDKGQGEFIVRQTVVSDRDEIIRATEDTGCFRPDEIAVACEVLDDALLKGPEGHYQSLTAELGGKAAGWICFGPTPCTLGTFDIYWIVVAADSQRRGIGKALMSHAEKMISNRGGRLSVIETSGKGLYEATRGFYHGMGYSEQARVAEFYAGGDDKIIYTKRLV